MNVNDTIEGLMRLKEHFHCLYAYVVEQDDEQVLEQAIKAAEKQVPKDVANIFPEQDKQYTFACERKLFPITGHCPGCNAVVTKSMKFCFQCGQAIKWGVIE